MNGPDSPTPVRLAALGVLYALQRVSDVFDRLADTEGRAVRVFSGAWSLVTADEWGTDTQRLYLESRDDGSMDYPYMQHRVDRLGPVVLAYDDAIDSRGHVTVLYARREVTDGSLQRAYDAEVAADNARMAAAFDREVEA